MARQSLLACSILALTLTLTVGAPAVRHAKTVSTTAVAVADRAGPEAASAVRDGCQKYLFRTELLSRPDFPLIEMGMFKARGTVGSVDAFLRCFNRMCLRGPISYVTAQAAQGPVGQTTNYLDATCVGKGGRYLQSPKCQLPARKAASSRTSLTNPTGSAHG